MNRPVDTTPGAPAAGAAVLVACLILLAAGVLVIVTTNRGPSTQRQARIPVGAALTPPMGYNDWNAFHCNVSERLIEQTADAMVRTGLRAAGYRYVNVDDCWEARTRTRDGRLRADPARFPHGMRALAAYVHARGLKFGLYAGAGTATCEGRPGSFGHEALDAATFAAWGVDYLKDDWCAVPAHVFRRRTGSQVARLLFTRMARALSAGHRPIVLSLSNGGNASLALWRWSRNIASLWRTTRDITPSWSRVLAILDGNLPLGRYAGAGHWNDPDMLEVGNRGLTAAEGQAHFSLWSIMAAPLIAGTDVRAMSPATRATLTNREVIAVDQDPLGVQGHVVMRRGDGEIIAKPLAHGACAVVLLNRGTQRLHLIVAAGHLGLPAARRYLVQDLWTHRSRCSTGAISGVIGPHAAAMLRIARTRAC